CTRCSEWLHNGAIRKARRTEPAPGAGERRPRERYGRCIRVSSSRSLPARGSRGEVMSRLPRHVVPYFRTQDFTDETVPERLLHDHVTRRGAWARLVVTDG